MTDRSNSFISLKLFKLVKVSEALVCNLSNTHLKPLHIALIES